MTGKTQAVRQPSIDELLTSIRQAIHERASDVPARSASAVDAPPPDRSGRDQAPQQAADRPAMKRTIVTSNREGFAGLLGGDVRLAEALARLNQTGSRGRAESPRVPEMAEEAIGAVASTPAEPRLKPSIEQWTGGLAAAAEPAPVTQDPVSPERVAPEPVPTAADRLADARKHAAPERTRWTDKPWQDEPRAAPRATERFARPAPSSTLGSTPGSSFSSTSRPESDDLLSTQAASAANSAFNRLSNAAANRPSGRDSALDEMTRDCLRPLLKEWLDANLPSLVERLVREEIERVARTGRSSPIT